MYFYHSKAFAQTALCGSASCEISIFFFICVLLYDIEAVESSCCVFELCICEARCVFKPREGETRDVLWLRMRDCSEVL